jgi:hypothetical protein
MEQPRRESSDSTNCENALAAAFGATARRLDPAEASILYCEVSKWQLKVALLPIERPVPYALN